MKIKLPARTKCAPAIWKKFSDDGKLLWNRLYEEFSDTFQFPPWMEGEFWKKSREIAAHNHACTAVWAFEEFLKQKKISTNLMPKKGF